MRIRSTGLGKTLLGAHVGTIEPSKVIPETLEASTDEPTRLLFTMEVTDPVHWTVRAFLEPADLRLILKLLLTRPGTLFCALRFLFSKGPQEKPKSEAKAEGEAKSEA